MEVKLMLMDKIRDLAKKQNMTIAELCEKSGVPYSCIYEWNNHEPSASRLLAVANVLGTTVEELMKED
jgi:transcriptional regulator with XRE-family HTH domain